MVARFYTRRAREPVNHPTASHSTSAGPTTDPYLVMEYRRQDLARLMSERAAPTAAHLRLVSAVLGPRRGAALGVVHRDLNPKAHERLKAGRDLQVVDSGSRS